MWMCIHCMCACVYIVCVRICRCVYTCTYKITQIQNTPMTPRIWKMHIGAVDFADLQKREQEVSGEAIDDESEESHISLGNMI